MDGTRRSRFRRRLGHGKVREQCGDRPRDVALKCSGKATAARAAMLQHSNANSAVRTALFFEEFSFESVWSSSNKMLHRYKISSQPQRSRDYREV